LIEIHGGLGDAFSHATSRGISVESVQHVGIVEIAGGKVRIRSRDEIDNAWEPEVVVRLTVWECLHHLARKHQKEGISHVTGVLSLRAKVT
jgi:putative DNA methylase